MLPWVFEDGFEQLIVNGGATLARVNSSTWPPVPEPLNARTQA